MSDDRNPGADRETRPADGAPHGWVQWKGTNVCMDARCPCGALTHVDADFLYYLRCGACGATYWVNGHVELVPLTADEAAKVERERGVVASETDEGSGT